MRPASDDLPYKFETGTQNHEGIAGVLDALEYFEWLASQFGDEQAEVRADRKVKIQILWPAGILRSNKLCRRSANMSLNDPGH